MSHEIQLTSIGVSDSRLRGWIVFWIPQQMFCVWFQHILLQNGGKLHVKDIADGIVESGLVQPRLVLRMHINICDHALQVKKTANCIYSLSYLRFVGCKMLDSYPVVWTVNKHTLAFIFSGSWSLD